ncbi:iron-containing alcohol dehydrogenase [Desulfococcaceae bacterium HSG7]|nr:iron-containing alcohol dehydrogenase [Desulfococcaceae bacterium HSG7]
MKNFHFQGVGAISFGVDRIEQLGDDINVLPNKVATVVLISDAGVASAGITDRVKTILERCGYDVVAFSDLDGEPKSESVDEAAAIVRDCKQPCVVGLGGGSALDVAKLAAVIAGDDSPAEDYALCARSFPKPALPRIMIPTTAGTGSEVTLTAIFSTYEGRKVWAWGQELKPESVILDPRLTVSLPKSVTAATGLDALVHAIEACTCKARNTFTDSFALNAISLARQHLMTAIEKPNDLPARGGMLLASTLAGIAFGSTGTGAAHAIGHALGTVANVSHGRSVAIGLDVLLKRNAEASPEAHAAVVEALGGDRNPLATASAFRNLLEQTGINLSLADKKIDPAILAAVMMSEENIPMIENNASRITTVDALDLARQILNQ